ncbi:flavodoxin family protein [Algoriphagus confluentis]|uniref:NAD(P)H:quinone oxidoreductase type IV n=1 Tax=Algoriphagus confluentis TaxID=1697556 RepID=A0ABQ6PLI1_9BACT|nr:NAD(P)H:quinone oxidoreductase type IV [Algoriphagus confluentis]
MRFLIITLLFLGIFSQNAHGQDQPMVLVAYFSQFGNTQVLAEAIADGAESVGGVEIKLLPIDQVETQDLFKASAIILGSPVYNGNPAPQVLEFINSWPFEGRPLKDKIGAAFATGGGISIGEEGVMIDILRAMLIHGMIIVGGEEVEAAFGASSITGEGPFNSSKNQELFYEKARGLGKRVALLALRLP